MHAAVVFMCASLFSIILALDYMQSDFIAIVNVYCGWPMSLFLLLAYKNQEIDETKKLKATITPEPSRT